MGAQPNQVASGNPGQVASALSGVRTAIAVLEKELANIPLDNPAHKAVLNAIKSLSNHVPPGSAVPGQQMTSLQNAMQQARQSAAMQNLQKMSAAMPTPGGTSPPGGSPAAAPPGGA